MWIAFFFFFYSYYFALEEMFFIAEVLTKLETMEFKLFWGRSFMTSFFFLSPLISPSYPFYPNYPCSFSSFPSFIFRSTSCWTFFYPCLGWISFNSAWDILYIVDSWCFWMKSRGAGHHMIHNQLLHRELSICLGEFR